MALRHGRRTWVAAGSLGLATVLTAGLLTGAGPLAGLASPAGATAGLGYQPGEVWGGGNPSEQCAVCTAQGLVGADSAESVQTGQAVDPSNGDFSTGQSIFSLPTAAGTFGLSLTYDAQRGIAQTLHPPTYHYADPYPFGAGWQSSFTASLSFSAYGVTVNQANGAQVNFVDVGTTTTPHKVHDDGCPEGDYQDIQKYTVPHSVAAFCSSYRTDAQLGIFTYGAYQFDQAGGASTSTFTMYGQLAAEGNAENTDAVSFNYTVHPGTGCPSTASTGCDLEKDNVGSRIIAAVLSHGRITKAIDPMSRSYTFGYTDGQTHLNTIINPTSATTTYAYNTSAGNGTGYNNELLSVTDPDGTAEQIGYNAGMATSITDPAYTGQITTFHYQTSSCVTSMTGCLTQSSSQVTTVVYPDGEHDVDYYNGGVMATNCYGASLSCSSDHEWYFTYSYTPTINTTIGHGKEAVAGPGGLHATVLYDAVGNVTQYTDPAGHISNSMYNDDGYHDFDELCWSAGPTVSVASNVTCTTPPAGSTHYGYNQNGEETSVTDPMNNTTRNGYYNNGELCWSAPPSVGGGGSCTNGGTTPTGAPTGSTSYGYTTGVVINKTVAAGESYKQVTLTKYNADGQETYTIPPNGQSTAGGFGSNSYETATTYYPNGLVDTVTAPATSGTATTTNTYDATGHVLTETDPGGVTTNTYDSLGRLCWTIRATSATSGTCTPGSAGPTGSTTDESYLATTSAPTATVDANGKTTTYTYGNAVYPTKPTVTHDPMGTAVTYTNYNTFGQVCLTGPVNSGSTACAIHSGDTFSRYTVEGQLTSTTDPSGVAMTYLYANSDFPTQPTSTKYASRTTTYSYNADGQPDKTVSPGTTNGASTVVTTDYNADSEPCWTAPVTWPSTSPNFCGVAPSQPQVSVYSYNTAGERTQMIDNNNTASQVIDTYTYDATGHLKTATTDNSRTVSYAYNKAGEASCIAYPVKTGPNCANAPSSTNSVVDQHYNSAGQQVSTTDWLGHTIGYATYTAKGQIQKVTYPTTSAETVSYGYTKDGNVTALHYAGPVLNGQSDSYGFNTDDELSSTGGIVTSASDTYTSYKRVAKATDPLTPTSNVTDTYRYNADGTVGTITPSSGSVQTDTYNGLDELTKQSQPTHSTTTTTATVGSAISVTSASGIATTPNGTKAYVSNYSAKTVTPITLSTGTKGTPISVPSTAGSIAINPAGTKAYVLAGGLVPITLATGTAGTAIGAGPIPAVVGINPSGTKAYVLNYFFAEVTPITLTSGTTLSAIPVGSGPQAIAFNPTGTKAYVANWASKSVTPITLSSGTALSAISVPNDPASVVVNPSGTTAYVSIQTTKDIVPITLSSGTLKTPIAIGYKTGPVLMNAGGTTLYVMAETSAKLVGITVATGSIKATASLSGSSSDALVPGTTKVYVTYRTGNTVTPVTFASTRVTSVPRNAYNADGERCWSAMSSSTGTCSTSAPSGATSYGWNGLGQMCWSGSISNATAGCSSPPAGTTSYTYDGQGLRVKETPPSGTASSFTWDTVTGGGTPLDIDDGTNAYIYGPTGTAPEEQINISTGAVSFLVSASSGVQAVFNSAGSLQEEAEYSTYGGQVLLSGSKVTPFGFQGSYTDASGLDYLVNRYYTSTTDQFLSVDPDLVETGQPYAFTTDDPLNMTDPLGLKGWYCVDDYNGHAGYSSHYFQGTKYGSTPSGKCGSSSNGPSLAQFAAAYDNWWAQQLATAASAFRAAEATEPEPAPHRSSTPSSDPSPPTTSGLIKELHDLHQDNQGNDDDQTEGKITYGSCDSAETGQTEQATAGTIECESRKEPNGVVIWVFVPLSTIPVPVPTGQIWGEGAGDGGDLVPVPW